MGAVERLRTDLGRDWPVGSRRSCCRRLILSLFQIGFLARMTRSAMLDVLSQDYIRTAARQGQ